MGVMFYVWIGVIIASVVIEILTEGLTSFWFAIGGAGALILNCFLHDEYIYIQIIVFILLSIASIVLLRPLLKKRFDVKKTATNIDLIIGSSVFVTERIEKNIPGAVKVEGVVWTAVSEKDSFEVNDLVVVKKVDGNKLIVEKGGK